MNAVYSGLSAGTTVRWEDWSPTRGRRQKEGIIVEVDEEGERPDGTLVFDRYKVEFDRGWAWITADDVIEVLSNG